MSNKEVNIIIAEKSSMWNNIAWWLDGMNIKERWLIKNKSETVFITWWVWHIIELKWSAEIDEKYKLWKLENLPILINHADHYQVVEDKIDQYNTIKKIFQRSDWKIINIYHAWDPDREWELITRNIVTEIKKELPNLFSNNTINEYRVWINEFSKAKILKELKDKKPLSNYNNFFEAAKARAHSDWSFWMNLSPFYSIVSWSYKNPLSVWRVQSWLLKIVVDKEVEIRNFTETTSYKLLWNFDNNIITEWFSKKRKDWKLNSKQEFEMVKKKVLELKYFEVHEKNSQIKKEGIEWLYNIVDIQVDAEKKFWYKPKETDSIVQSLYEKYKIISYPRPDSGFINDEDWENMQWPLKELESIKEYGWIIQKLKERDLFKANDKFVNSKKVWAHSWIHIILPQKGTWLQAYSQINDKEKGILDLIISRLFAIMNWDYEYESSELILKNDVHFFRLRWNILKNKGWKEFYWLKSKDKEDTVLPKLEKWDILSLKEAKEHIVKTQKPTRYSQASLAKAVNNLALLVKDDKELSARIKQISPKWDRQLWLWTQQARWEIIDKLERVGFIESKSKKIQPTEKWFKLVSMLDSDFINPITTAQWEDYLKKIEEWEYTYEEFMNWIEDTIKNIVKNKVTINEWYEFWPTIKDSIGQCPICWIWELTEFEKWFWCTTLECKFVIWKDFIGWEITKDIAIDIISWKTTKKVKLFSKKKNKHFETSLKLDKKEWKIVFA